MAPAWRCFRVKDLTMFIVVAESMSECLLSDEMCGVGGVVLHTRLLSLSLVALINLASAMLGRVGLPSESEEQSFPCPDSMCDHHMIHHKQPSMID